jgi:uncharacterized Tic20 family protein
MSEFENATAAPPPPSGSAPQEDRTLALIAHLLGIISWFVGPLIIWLISKDNAAKGFVTDQAKEALNFQITVAIGVIISYILMGVVIGIVLLPLIALASIIFSIMGAVAENQGRPYKYPFSIKIVK